MDAAREIEVLDFSWFPGRVDVGFLVRGLGLGLMSVSLLGLSSCWHDWLSGHYACGAL